MPERSTAETTEINLEILAEVPVKSRRPRVRVEFAALSDPGKVRANNEDHFLVSQMGRTFRPLKTNMPPGELPGPVDDESYGMVVADGMGGMAAGEKASQLAIRTGVELVLNSPLWTRQLDESEARKLKTRLRDYFQKVDSVVIGQGKHSSNLHGMGTTLTLAYSVGVEVFIVHVGDSRAYLFRDHKLEQLTHDHTVAQNLADLGAIKAEDVSHHATRHVLTNFVGGPSHGVEPDISRLKIQDEDVLLLCSDGLTEMVPNLEIAEILKTARSLDAAAQSLIQAALDHGGRDNVTVILGRYEVD